MSAVYGPSLHAVDGDGVRVVEEVTRESLAGEDFGAAVVEADGQPAGVGGGHRVALACDEAAIRSRREGHHAIATGVPLAAWRFDLGAFDLPGGELPSAGAFVESGDGAAAPGEQDRFVTGS